MSNQEVADSNSRKDSHLPEFISTPTPVINTEEDNKHKWLANNMQRLMIWVSIIWFGIVLIYITQFFGWSNLFLMMPDEFGGFLAGVTLPLAIIWVVMAYIDRGASFKQEAKLLHAYMNQLVYPEEGGAQTAKAMADAIRAQVIELQEVTKQATEQTDKIQAELSNRVEDFAKLVGILDNYSSKTITELTDGIKTLINSFDYVAERAAVSTENLQSKVSDFSAAGEQIRTGIESIFESLQPRIQELQSSSAQIKNVNDENNSKMLRANELLVEFHDRVSKNIEYITSMVGEQTKHLENVAEQSIKSAQDLQSTVQTNIQDIENTLKNHQEFSLNYVETLDNNISGLSRKFSEQNEALGVEVEKILARASNVSESISNQVDNIRNVSDEVIENLNNVDGRIGSEVKSLQQHAEETGAAISGAVTVLEQQSNKLSLMSANAVKNIGDMADNMNSQSEKMGTTADNMVEKMAKVAADVEQRNRDLRVVSESAVDKLNEVIEVMNKHTDSLKETTSIVQTQSQISETSLVQQQRHITATAAKIEDIKAELKRQIEDLVKASDSIESNAGEMVNNLQKQLEKALQSCNSVVESTRHLGENLEVQTAAFDAETAKSIEKASEFENIVRTQVSSLNQSGAQIENIAKSISEILSRQISSLSDTAEHTAKSMDLAVNAFEKQNTSIQAVTDNTIRHVADMVQVMDEKAEAINQLFNHQENEFFEICDKITENTNNIGSSLKKQVSVIEQNSDRVFGRMAMLEENFNKHADEVVKISGKSIDKLSEVYNVISEQQNAAGQHMEDIADKLGNLYKGFQSGLDTLGSEVGKIEQEAMNSTEKLLSSADKVQNLHQQLGDGAKNISGLMENHAKNLEGSLNKVRSQTDMINDTLNHQKDSLSDIVNVVSTQARLGEASMAQQYKMLSDVSSEVAQKIGEINGKFKDSTDNIFEITSKLSYEFDVLGDKLLSVSQDVSKAAKSSIKNIEQVNLSLNQSSDELNGCVNKTVTKIGDVGKEYEKYIANFNTVTAEASTGVVEINKMISEQGDKMTTITQDTKQLVEFFNKVLNDTSMEFSKRAQQAYDKVKGFGESLKSLSLQIGETAKMSSIHMENSSDKIRSSISEISSNAERISNEIRSSGEVFLQQSNVLVAATDETIKKVNAAMQSIQSATTDFDTKGADIVNKSNELNTLFSQQMTELHNTSQKADNKITELEKRYKHLKVENFLKDAGYVVEKLETMAVDINRIFTPDAEEELWKKYYAGDTAAFVRYLSRSMNKQQILQIRSEFEKNLEFRDLVTRYMSDFEALIAEAKKNERSNVLMAVISGSDVGKLYYILARSLDKLN